MLFHAGEAEVEAPELERKLAVIDAQQVQDRGLHVVDVHRVLHDVETEIVRATEREAGANPAAREPHRKRLRVMVAAQAPAEGGTGFHHRRAAEFAAPDDQRIFQQSPAFQIKNQRR